jgi:hypothetical protein
MQGSMTFTTFRLALFSLLLALPGLAGAQVDDGLVQDEKPKEVKKTEGWDFLLTPGGSLSLSDNRAVVGQPEGMSLTFGVNLKAGALYKKSSHQFRSDLEINETFTRTPVIDDLIKSTDIFKFEALYLYGLLDWLGPYARFSLSTNLLESYAVQPDFARWRRVNLDGSEEFRTARKYRLTDGFSPLQLRESVGFFASPWAKPPFNVEFRAGFGAMHLLASGQLAVQDDGATEAIDLIELDSFNQAGAELGLSIWGELYEKKLTYKIAAEVLIPFVYSLPDQDTRGIGDLTNVELSATLSYKVLSWLSLDYVFRLVRVPQLIDATQIQNNLLLTASYSFFQPKKAAE